MVNNTNERKPPAYRVVDYRAIILPNPHIQIHCQFLIDATMYRNDSLISMLLTLKKYFVLSTERSVKSVVILILHDLTSTNNEGLKSYDVHEDGRPFTALKSM